MGISSYLVKISSYFNWREFRIMDTLCVKQKGRVLSRTLTTVHNAVVQPPCELPCLVSPPGASVSYLFYFWDMSVKEEGACFYARVKYFSEILCFHIWLPNIFLLDRKESLIVICGMSETSVSMDKPESSRRERGILNDPVCCSSANTVNE